MAGKCVHKACGKTFTDPEEDCVYHPGPPVFHEGQKGKYLGVQAIPDSYPLSPPRVHRGPLRQRNVTPDRVSSFRYVSTPRHC